MRLEHPLFKKLPAKLHPYVKLARLDRPIGTWLLLFPCWWSIVLAHGGIGGMTARAWGLAALFAAGALLMRGAGCVVNDLWDRELDARVERTRARPLAAGELSARQALSFLAVLLFPAFLILVSLPWMAVLLGLLSVPLVAAYPLMKRVTWWPQAFLGLTFNWGALMGWAAARGEIGAGAILLYAGGFFWTLAYDTVYAHQDREDDALADIRSTARLLGEKSRAWVGGFFALAIAFIVAAKFVSAPGILTPLLLAPVAWHAARQVARWDMNDARSCLDTFRSNAVFGWLVLAMVAF